ncbi:EamA-like transporter family protein [Polystyrenella longa]|uniref:EamA-like transporter family protein n=1 Tax=Polystyrenella longa TaxID=2528007 RepID=A0A518CK39_9PLAN|nr:DMT family transporter [Polystyrenella longa]QDU79577.1 EamA-like transporter family protein [Polystyrenella longa]
MPSPMNSSSAKQPASTGPLKTPLSTEPRWIGISFILLTSLMWSTSGAFVKSPAFADMPTDERGLFLACFRAMFAGLFLLPFALRGRFTWERPMLWMVLSFAVMNITFITAMSYTTAAAAIFLQCTSAIWAPLMSLVFLKEPFSRAHRIGLIPIAFGIVLFVFWDMRPEHLIGNLLALISGVAYAGVVVTLRQLRNHNPYYLACMNNLISGLVVLPWLLSINFFTGATAPDAIHWYLAIAMGILQLGLPYVLFGFGLKRVTAGEASLLVLIEPILNPLFVWLLWSIPVMARDVWGGSFILAGLLLRYCLEYRAMRALLPK